MTQDEKSALAAPAPNPSYKIALLRDNKKRNEDFCQPYLAVATGQAVYSLDFVVGR